MAMRAKAYWRLPSTMPQGVVYDALLSTGYGMVPLPRRFAASEDGKRRPAPLAYPPP